MIHLFDVLNDTPALDVFPRQAGSIKKGDRVELSLDFLPTGEVVLDGQDLICTIAGR